MYLLYCGERGGGGVDTDSAGSGGAAGGKPGNTFVRITGARGGGTAGGNVGALPMDWVGGWPIDMKYAIPSYATEAKLPGIAAGDESCALPPCTLFKDHYRPTTNSRCC